MLICTTLLRVVVDHRLLCSALGNPITLSSILVMLCGSVGVSHVRFAALPMHVMVCVECSYSGLPRPNTASLETSPDRRVHFFFDMFNGRRALTVQQVQSFLQSISPLNGESVIYNSILTSSEDIWKRALLNIQHSRQASQQVALHFMMAVLRIPFSDSRASLVTCMSSIASLSSLLGLSFNQEFQQALYDAVVEGTEAHSSLQRTNRLVSSPQSRPPVADPTESSNPYLY